MSLNWFLERLFVVSMATVAAASVCSSVTAKPPGIAIPQVGRGEVELNIGQRPSRPPILVPFPPIKNWNSLRITLSRSPCFGTCPGYDVEIHGDGSVIYTGREFVAVTGVHHSRMAQTAVRDLVDKFRSADYFRSFDSYMAPVTDNPAYQTSISFDGHRKVVGDYVGSEVGMPAEFSALENAIDEAAGTRKWIEITSETVPALKAEHYFGHAESKVSVLASLITAGATRDVVRELIAIGASVNGSGPVRFDEPMSPLEAAAQRGDREIIDALLKAGAGSNKTQLNGALSEAASIGRADLVQLFLNRGADAKWRDKDGTDVLMEAARSLDAFTVKEVLRAHADAHARAGDDRTALIFAVSADAVRPRADSSQLEVVRLLLDAGSDIDACDQSGDTPLVAAHSLKVIRVLIREGADVNKRCGSGSTPLETAQSLDRMRLLLSSGADPQAKAPDGRSVSDTFCGGGNEVACLFLKEWIATHPAAHSTAKPE